MNDAQAYIKTSLAAGKDIQTIKNELAQSGWTTQQIEKLLNEISKPPRSNKRLLVIFAGFASLILIVSVTLYSYSFISKRIGPKKNIESFASFTLSIPDSSSVIQTYYSTDKKNIAVVVKNIDGYYQVFLNGQENPPYELVSQGVFSPDGKRFVYVAKQGNDIFLVEDGKEKSTISFGAAQNTQHPEAITFSPDSKHLAYIIHTESGEAIVLDEKAQQPYPHIYSVNPSRKRLFFSPDSKHLAYVINNSAQTLDRNNQEENSKTQEQKLIIDNKEMAVGFKWIFEFVFSPDSKHYAFVGLKDDLATVYLDENDVYHARYATFDLGNGDIPSNLTFTTSTNELVFGGRRDGTQEGFIQVGQKITPIPFPISRNGIRNIIAGNNSQNIAYIANRNQGGNLGQPVVVINNQIKELPSFISSSPQGIATIYDFVLSSDMKQYAYAVYWEGYGTNLATIVHNQTPVKTYFFDADRVVGGPSTVNFVNNLRLSSDGFSVLYAAGRKRQDGMYDVSINKNGFESILTHMSITSNIFTSDSEDVIFSLTNGTVNYVAQNGNVFTPKSVREKDMIYHSNSYTQQVASAIKSFSEATEVVQNEEPLLYNNQDYNYGYGSRDNLPNAPFSIKDTSNGSSVLLYPINKIAYVKTTDGKVTKELLQ